MLIKVPDTTTPWQLEYLAEKLNCDLVCEGNGEGLIGAEFVERVIPENVVRFPTQVHPITPGPDVA